MTYDVVIIGAGPSGLACAVAAKQQGLSYLVVEQGGIGDAIRRFPTEMHFYSTPEMLSIAGLPFTSQGMRPTRSEALRYYRSLVQYHELSLQLHTKIISAQKTADGFSITAENENQFSSKNLILATGYFDSPILLDIPGENLKHVSHYYSEPYAYANSDVVVVGGGNSAVDTALELYRNSARVTLVHRGENLKQSIKYWTRPDIENRIKEGNISALFNTEICEITPESVYLRSTVQNSTQSIAANAVFILTGYKASLDLLTQLGADCNFDRGEPVHDGNFETSQPGLFCAGSANCGIHTSEIFIENGRTHAEKIIPALRR